MKYPYVTVWKGRAGRQKGRWRLHVRDANGKILLPLESYMRRPALIRAAVKSAKAILEWAEKNP